MIPRYAPTYTYSDLYFALKNSRSDNIERDLTGDLSKLLQAKHIFLLARARLGIYAILKAYNRPGRVLMPAYNCIVVPEAVIYAGYQPEFVDIELPALNVSASALEEAITADTSAVVLSHLFGIPSNVEEIRTICNKRDILIIEDAAAAFGAELDGKPVGCSGDAAVISFHSTKVISGGGGGALITNNDVLADSIKRILQVQQTTENTGSLFLKSIAYKTALNPGLYPVLRLGYRIINHERMYEVVKASILQPKGYVSRMPAYTCALIYKQLNRLDWNLRRRRKIAGIFREQLEGNYHWSLPEIPEKASPAWIQFPMICQDKPGFYRYMQSKGIDVSWTYKYSCAESFGLDNYPFSKQAAKKVISLPTSPTLTDEQANEICSKALGFSSTLN